MRRRDLLAVTGTVSGGMFAGCLGSQSPNGTPTETPIDTPAETPGSAEEGPTRWEVTYEDDPTRPAVDPLVYIGAGNTAYGLDPMNGEEVWTRTLDGTAKSVYSHGTVMYVTSGEESGAHGPETVNALEAMTGERRWSFELDKPASVFARGDGLVILKTFDDIANGRERLYAVETHDGNTLWEVELSEPLSAELDDDVLFVASGARVQAIDVETGDILWRHSLDGYYTNSLTVGPETITVVTEPSLTETELLTLDRSGSERWTFDEWNVRRPILHEGRLFLGGVNVVAFDAESGDRKWQTGQRGSLRAPVTDRKLLVGDEGIRALAVEDGTKQWTYDLSKHAVPEGVRNGTAYIQTTSVNDEGQKHVYGVDIDDGTELWHLATDSELWDLDLGRQGAYVLESAPHKYAGTLYALS